MANKPQDPFSAAAAALTGAIVFFGAVLGVALVLSLVLAAVKAILGVG